MHSGPLSTYIRMVDRIFTNTTRLYKGSIAGSGLPRPLTNPSAPRIDTTHTTHGALMAIHHGCFGYERRWLGGGYGPDAVDHLFWGLQLGFSWGF